MQYNSLEKGKKYRAWNKGRKFPEFSGENHPHWKGGLPFCKICKKQLSVYKINFCAKHVPRPVVPSEQRERMRLAKIKENPSYNTIHRWLEYKFKKKFICSNKNCPKKSKAFQWALKMGKKHERKIENYIELCASCHRNYDVGLIKNRLKIHEGTI